MKFLTLIAACLFLGGCLGDHGYETKNLEEKDVVGTYHVMDGAQRAEIPRPGHPSERLTISKSMEVALHADHTAELTDVLVMPLSGSIEFNPCTTPGHWRFLKEGEYMTIFVMASKDTGGTCDGGAHFLLIGSKPPYGLTLVLGDPDTTDEVPLEKIQ